MDDKKIVELLFARSETALDEVSCKYSRLYKGIIREILSDEWDVDECGNDVLLAVWNTIPPNRIVNTRLTFAARNIGQLPLGHTNCFS